MDRKTEALFKVWAAITILALLWGMLGVVVSDILWNGTDPPLWSGIVFVGPMGATVLPAVAYIAIQLASVAIKGWREYREAT